MQATLFDYSAPIALLLVASMFLSSLRSTLLKPAQVILWVWVAVLSVHGIVTTQNLIDLHPSTLKANLLIVASAIALSYSFSFWSIVLRQAGRKTMRDRATEGPQMPTLSFSRYLVPVLFLTCLISTSLLYFRATQIIGSYNVFSALMQLRRDITSGEASFGYLRYLSTTSIVMAVFSFIITKGRDKKTRRLSYTMLLLAILSATISTQRTTLFLILIATAFSDGVRKLPSIKSFMALIVISSGFFTLIGYLVGKIGSVAHGGLSVQLAWEKFLLYLLSPLSAFSASKIWDSPSMDQAYSLRFFAAILSKLGLSHGDLIALEMPNAYVPFATNVYTFAYVPIHDFGALFFIYFIVIGALLAFSFSLSEKHPLSRAFLGFAYYPILLSFYQDQFATLTSMWIQIFATLYILSRFTYTR